MQYFRWWHLTESLYCLTTITSFSPLPASVNHHSLWFRVWFLDSTYTKLIQYLSFCLYSSMLFIPFFIFTAEQYFILCVSVWITLMFSIPLSTLSGWLHTCSCEWFSNTHGSAYISSKCDFRWIYILKWTPTPYSLCISLSFYISTAI